MVRLIEHTDDDQEEVHSRFIVVINPSAVINAIMNANNGCMHHKDDRREKREENHKITCDFCKKGNNLRFL
jgi:hypothetical protein